MAKRKKPNHKKLEFKSAFVSVNDAELGWSGPKGGRTVRLVFRGGAGDKVGELQISAATLRWWGVRNKQPIEVSTKHLGDLFEAWRST
jgi:hypothetical protein